MMKEHQERANGWRQLKRQRSHPIAAILLTPLLLWLTFMIATLLERGGEVGIWVVLPATFLALLIVATVSVVGTYSACLILIAFSGRFWRPRPVPPPPGTTPPPIEWINLPLLKFPKFPAALGQCGWLELSLQIGPDGKILGYKIVDQAPARVFERAVLTALLPARAKSTPSDPSIREAAWRALFIVPTKLAPDWAQQILANQTREPDNVSTA
ncbi:MAG: hypothetical protein ABUL42_01605 [Terricaulis silvestris]